MLHSRQLQTGTVLYVSDALRGGKYQVRVCRRSRPTRVLACLDTLAQAVEYVESYTELYLMAS